ncbi:ankyrin repeat domain-containing protein [Wolbachia endosymbiont of Diaphorina citri]|uniref:ankyrin repeat domain-containing protein n=1 Tax=Wolbachia endosymbiont of Diaphorina citri TaxID=116598 RepID=UPI00155EE0B3|nr:ankyrin repeat domain-containing protein [Wolbachia endosymbiont of Diaphorina citri]QJT93924.1 ankyrin repeat domain-containing protein [Wolbachia endosymbiont of Diaphorina citri]QJT95164.1 ankyrin repeat domain-containing protein [Wolbachia endosymbiont of Diaphorina citri]QJT96411.1 ankyrin repeat domain-containing protein [Wolbachia endosymbiont of Diaphorina citri]QLK10821.1 ankyrin repeat domain-containing protein [Wolbachia endosymbiont of Diaphorina citri]QXY86491.1 ankyrin repeat 
MKLTSLYRCDRTWINAKTYDTLFNSFRNLAKELGISTENHIDLNVVRDRGIESIVKDVYKYVRDVKSLFIFDNATNYEEIEKFLPSYFPNLFFHGEKPYVLITSRSKNWEKEIEKTQLNDGFSLGEAITFIERALEVKDRLQDYYLVGLAQTLGYLPLALTQATAYITQEKINVSEYLKLYNEEMKKPNPNCLEALGLTKELFITLTLNLDKIKREENVGQQSHDIVSYMAYLDPNQIDIEEIFLQKESEKGKQQVLDALNLLNKFSVIELEKSIARVHKGIQKTVRVEKERTGIEEETLREIMTSFSLINPNHIISVWSHVSKYDRLVNEFIDSIYDKSTILHLLAKDGNEEVIKLILEKIEPNKLSKVINAIDEKNFTSLDYAIIHGHLGTVQHLVRKGGDVNLKNTKGMNPLHFAAVYGHLDIAKYLVAQGAIIKSLNKDSMCPLHFAAIYGHLDIIKYLVEEGASINIKDKNNMRPLHFAVIYGRLDIVEYLVEKRANINLRSKEGESPLHFAVMHSQLDIVEYLIEKGASIDRQDEKNMSPLDYVIVYSNSEEIICYLEDMHLAPDLKTQSHKRNLETFDEHTPPKKRKLKNMSATSEENASNIQLFQSSQNLPSDILMSVDLFNRMEMESVVNFTNTPMFLLNRVTVESTNKDLRL